MPETPHGPLDEELRWLLRRKVTVPDRPADHWHRPELVARCMPTNQRITLLTAPGGFGKTTLLAETCHHLMEAGTLAAWLSVDEYDAPTVLETYLAFALREAGLDLSGVPSRRDDGEGSLRYRTVHLIGLLEAHATPCVLVLDEVERLPGPSAAVLNLLLERGPPNLHIAIACRDLTTALDVAPAILVGQAAVLTPDDLRFSSAEIARLFEARWSESELASLTAESAGWPLALRICLHRLASGERGGSVLVGDIARHWLDSRMWRGVSQTDRDLILDAGLFEWFDGALLQDALGAQESWQRLRDLPALTGLLEQADNDYGDTWRLHPLLSRYCVEWRRRNTPERLRQIYLRIARALAHRGAVVAAMRHAAEANDSALAANILQDAGAVRLWLREGVVQLQAAERFLTPQMLDRYPRLALAHCAVSIMTGRLDEARRAYARMEETVAAARVADSDDDPELTVDRLQVGGLMALYGCRLPDTVEVQSVMEHQARLLETAQLDPLTRGAFELGQCIVHGSRAKFSASLDRAERARQAFGRSSPYLAVHGDFWTGAAAMAQGRVREAGEWYARGRRVAQTDFLQDPGLTAMGDAFVRELELERNRIVLGPGDVKNAVAPRAGGIPFDPYAAASGTVVDLTLDAAGVDAALTTLDEMLDYTYGAPLPAASRHLAALRVATLARADRVGEAERTWRLAGLPPTQDGCLDLQAQSWRQMEAVACARLRLLHSRGEFQAARTLARTLASVAQRHTLRRTWMRCLALAMGIEVAAGERAAAADLLAQFLCLFEETDYARPLVRERSVSLSVTQDLLDGHPPAALAALAESLLEDHLQPTGPGVNATVTTLSDRELQVLRCLEHQRDREIAAALGISRSGVRYHARNVFRKLRARSRMDAVHLARRMGLLPET